MSLSIKWVNFENIMGEYFEEFKRKMKKRIRIPQSLIDQYYYDICILVDVDYTYAKAVIPRISWLRPLPYEININEVIGAITTLLVE